MYGTQDLRMDQTELKDNVERDSNKDEIVQERERGLKGKIIPGKKRAK
jgi:hypothetical protein